MISTFRTISAQYRIADHLNRRYFVLFGKIIAQISPISIAESFFDLFPGEGASDIERIAECVVTDVLQFRIMQQNCAYIRRILDDVSALIHFQ